MSNEYCTRKISTSFVCTLVILCLVLQGCDSGKHQKIHRKITVLQDEVSSQSQQFDEQAETLGQHSAKILLLERNMERLEASLTRRIENAEKILGDSIDDGEIDKIITQVASIEKRITALDAQLQQIDRRLAKLETAATQSGTKKPSGTDTPDLIEIEKVQHDLIRAHNNLTVEISVVSEKVKNLDACINDYGGDYKVSYGSWLLELKQKVETLKRDFDYSRMY